MATPRITENQLESLVDHINKLTGMPARPWVNGKAQVGNFHISYEYSGVCLCRVVDNNGAVVCPLGQVHEPKRDLHMKLQAFIYGLECRA